MSEVRRARRVTPPPVNRSDPTALRFLVGVDLRRTRERAGLTQSAAAAVIGCTQTKINYMEIGRTRQKPDEVVALLQAFGADAAHIDRLASLSGRSERSTWWAPFSDVLPDWFQTFVGLEGIATSEFAYTMALFPGQLQTPEYATAVTLGSVKVSEVGAPQVVRARMARQRLTTDVDPLRFQAVLEQHVVERLVGGPGVLAAQLDHVLSLMARENVDIRIVPTTVAIHSGLGNGDFVVLDFDQAQSIGYVEFATGALYVQDEADLGQYELVSDRLLDVALSSEDTVALIRARIAELTEQENST